MGLVRRRLSAHARDVEVGLAALRAYAQAIPAARPLVAPVLAAGEDLAVAIRMRRATPADLSEWRAQTTTLIRRWSLTDPGSARAYIESQPAADRRLLSSLSPPH